MQICHAINSSSFLSFTNRGRDMANTQRHYKIIKVSCNHPHLTLNEIAISTGLTKERVRQIEAKALSKLRKKMMERGLDSNTLLHG